MTGRSQDGSKSQNSRDKRLSEALRANLSRRKRQQRERAIVGPAGDSRAAEGDDGRRTDVPAAHNTGIEESS